MTHYVVQRERSSDAEDPDATSEGAYSETEAQQSHHEAGGRLALLGFADLEEPISIKVCSCIFLRYITVGAASGHSQGSVQSFLRSSAG